MSERPVRFGLVGYGLFGAHHARAIDGAPSAELAAIAVKSEASRQAAREAHPGAAVMADYRELVQHSDVDVVDVVVPNQMHFEVARAALEADKHVLLEKPMALRVDECDRLIRLAEQRDRVLAVGHELRLSSLWAGVKQLIDQDAIGRVQHVLIELSRFPYRQGSEAWRYDIQRVGSWILEEPIHFFDLARWYLAGAGEPQAVFARANSRHGEHPELLDNFTAVVDFPGDAYAVVSQTLAAFGHHQSAKVSGTRGTIWATWSAADARSDRPVFQLRYGLGQDVHEVPLDKPAGELLELAEEIEAVARCVISRQPPPCCGEDGRWSTLLCLAAQEALRNGGCVSVQTSG